MLRERVQTEALRTYLFAYGLHYASVSQDQLAASFQLPDKKARCSLLPGVLVHVPASRPLSCHTSVLFSVVPAAVNSFDKVHSWRAPPAAACMSSEVEMKLNRCRCTPWSAR